MWSLKPCTKMSLATGGPSGCGTRQQNKQTEHVHYTYQPRFRVKLLALDLEGPF